MDNAKRKMLLAKYKEKLREAQEKHVRETHHCHVKLNRLKRGCKHELIPLTEDQLANKWMSVHATCDICEEDFGWRCKVSPDGVCHYYLGHDGNKIELIDGSKVDPPEGWLDTYDCIYCGFPEERK